MTRLKWTLLFLALIGAASVGAGVYAWKEANTWSFRRDLPLGAEDIHEVFWEDGFLPDYKYQLRATLSFSDYQTYVARLGCTPHTATRTYSDDLHFLQWPTGRTEPSWWRPSESLEHTCVSQGNDEWVLVKYENRHVYVYAMNH